MLAQRGEVHLCAEHFAQRVQVVGIELVRRQQAQRNVGHGVQRRMVQPQGMAGLEPGHPAERAIALRRVRDREPERVQGLARAGAAALQQPVGQHRAVHGAGAGGADALDRQPAVLQQAVEHAPGEGAVHAAALQGKRHGFVVWLVRLHPRLPPWRAMRARQAPCCGR
ncbi:hypothetical protein D3C81_1656280 [compost metagenome]